MAFSKRKDNVYAHLRCENEKKLNSRIRTNVFREVVRSLPFEDFNALEIRLKWKDSDFEDWFFMPTRLYVISGEEEEEIYIPNLYLNPKSHDSIPDLSVDIVFVENAEEILRGSTRIINLISRIGSPWSFLLAWENHVENPDFVDGEMCKIGYFRLYGEEKKRVVMYENTLVWRRFDSSSFSSSTM
jgi:hypothetical protein